MASSRMGMQHLWHQQSALEHASLQTHGRRCLAASNIGHMFECIADVLKEWLHCQFVTGFWAVWLAHLQLLITKGTPGPGSAGLFCL